MAMKAGSMLHDHDGRQVLDYYGTELRGTYKKWWGKDPECCSVCGEALREMFDIGPLQRELWVCTGEKEPRHKQAYQCCLGNGQLTVFGHPERDEAGDPFDSEGYWYNMDDDTYELLEELHDEYRFWVWVEVPA